LFPRCGYPACGGRTLPDRQAEVPAFFSGISRAGNPLLLWISACRSLSRNDTKIVNRKTKIVNRKTKIVNRKTKIVNRKSSIVN
jgi:hypothetical protein